MTITLGSVTINSDMYLEGVEKANGVVTQQERTIDGVSYLTVVSNPGGRLLTLGTSQLGNAIQGFWCQDIIDALKILEDSGDAQTLDYHGTTYTVVITGMSGINQFLQWEEVGPNKKYIGVIQLTEV